VARKPRPQSAEPENGLESPALDARVAPFGGYVDFYGYHRTAGGWVFVGWVAHTGSCDAAPLRGLAQFSGEAVTQQVVAAYFSRGDVAGRGIGFVFFFKTPEKTRQALEYLSVVLGGAVYRILPNPKALQMQTHPLLEWLGPILSKAPADAQRDALALLLLGKPQTVATSGFIDFYGYHPVARGWLLCSWVGQGWPATQPPEHLVLSFEDDDLTGESLAVLYPRQDLEGSAEGAVFFVRAPDRALGRLQSISFMIDGVRIFLQPIPDAPKFRELELLAELVPIVQRATPCLHRSRLLGILSQQRYQGNDTLEQLSLPVFMSTDEAILCGPAGVVLIGWFLAKPGVVRALRVRSGTYSVPLNLADAIKIERPDVLAAFPEEGFEDLWCGFAALLPLSLTPHEHIYIEVETCHDEIGYRNVCKPKLSGMPAIKRLLERFDFRLVDLQHAYDSFLGPAVQALNRTRLSVRPLAQVLEYGALPQAPKFSVIVPLYGRLDFVEYQLALFSKDPKAADVEFIYVLDDPAKRAEAQSLFASIFERTLVPFRAVLLDRNLGYAPANNIGLEYAQGVFVAYLNSDVFAGGVDWLERLAERLEADPQLGVIGPLLRFEDGSVQHRGMSYKQLPEFGNLFFCMHQDKGLRYNGPAEVQRCTSITGACMVLRRELAVSIGGFDETYIIGDFEDSDLCFRLRELGLDCAVDTGVALYHLERKSQLGSAVSWRMNLTLYNAWQHQRRWGATIAEIAAP
jgi:GT2 family glycosyltransferase